MPSEPAREDELTPAEDLQELLEVVVEALGLVATVRVEGSDERISGSVDGDDLGLLIGRNGQTIDALQHLAQRIVLRGGGGPRVTVDGGGYRAEREESLRVQADEAAEAALETGERYALPAMPAAERRVVHEHLRERGDVETRSEGEEPDRRLIVSPPAA